MAFCPNCGVKADGAKFCPSCGQALAQQPAAPEQPQQQNPQQTQPGAPPPKDKKKKGKTPFIIGGGVVVAAVVVCVLVFTGVFGLLNKTDPDEPNVSGDPNGKPGEMYEYIDDNGDTVIFFPLAWIEQMGGIDNFNTWLKAELDAEDYYETVYGKYYLLPFRGDDTPRDWLDGYPATTSGGGQTTEPPTTTDPPVQGGDAPNYSLPKNAEGNSWPASYLPSFAPKFPSGSMQTNSSPGYVQIGIEGAASGVLEQYREALVNAGWEFISDSWDSYNEQIVIEARKGDWVLYLNGPPKWDESKSIYTMTFDYEGTMPNNGDNQQNQNQSGDKPGDLPDLQEANFWPTNYLPAGTPVFPSDKIKVTTWEGCVTIVIDDSKWEHYNKYFEALEAAGWKISDSATDVDNGQVVAGYLAASKGSWYLTLQYFGSYSLEFRY